MEGVLNFKILGIPIPKQSFRFAIKENKVGVQYVSKYQSAEVVQDAKYIVSQLAEQLPPNFKLWDKGIMIRIQYVFPVPNAFSQKKIALMRNGKLYYKTTKPDLDNLDKQLFDSMEGKVFVNDSQICSRYSEKIYGDTPQTLVSVKHLC